MMFRLAASLAACLLGATALSQDGWVREAPGAEAPARAGAAWPARPPGGALADGAGRRWEVDGPWIRATRAGSDRELVAAHEVEDADGAIPLRVDARGRVWFFARRAILWTDGVELRTQRLGRLDRAAWIQDDAVGACSSADGRTLAFPLRNDGVWLCRPDEARFAFLARADLGGLVRDVRPFGADAFFVDGACRIVRFEDAIDAPLDPLRRRCFRHDLRGEPATFGGVVLVNPQVVPSAPDELWLRAWRATERASGAELEPARDPRLPASADGAPSGSLLFRLRAEKAPAGALVRAAPALESFEPGWIGRDGFAWRFDGALWQLGPDGLRVLRATGDGALVRVSARGVDARGRLWLSRDPAARAGTSLVWDPSAGRGLGQDLTWSDELPRLWRPDEAEELFATVRAALREGRLADASDAVQSPLLLRARPRGIDAWDWTSLRNLLWNRGEPELRAAAALELLGADADFRARIRAWAQGVEAAEVDELWTAGVRAALGAGDGATVTALLDSRAAQGRGAADSEAELRDLAAAFDAQRCAAAPLAALASSGNGAVATLVRGSAPKRRIEALLERCDEPEHAAARAGLRDLLAPASRTDDPLPAYEARLRAHPDEALAAGEGLWWSAVKKTQHAGLAAEGLALLLRLAHDQPATRWGALAAEKAARMLVERGRDSEAEEVLVALLAADVPELEPGAWRSGPIAPQRDGAWLLAELRARRGDLGVDGGARAALAGYARMPGEWSGLRAFESLREAPACAECVALEDAALAFARAELAAGRDPFAARAAVPLFRCEPIEGAPPAPPPGEFAEEPGRPHDARAWTAVAGTAHAGALRIEAAPVGTPLMLPSAPPVDGRGAVRLAFTAFRDRAGRVWSYRASFLSVHAGAVLVLGERLAGNGPTAVVEDALGRVWLAVPGRLLWTAGERGNAPDALSALDLAPLVAGATQPPALDPARATTDGTALAWRTADGAAVLFASVMPGADGAPAFHLLDAARDLGIDAVAEVVPFGAGAYLVSPGLRVIEPASFGPSNVAGEHAGAALAIPPGPTAVHGQRSAGRAVVVGDLLLERVGPAVPALDGDVYLRPGAAHALAADEAARLANPDELGRALAARDRPGVALVPRDLTLLFRVAGGIGGAPLRLERARPALERFEPAWIGRAGRAWRVDPVFGDLLALAGDATLALARAGADEPLAAGRGRAEAADFVELVGLDADERLWLAFRAGRTLHAFDPNGARSDDDALVWRPDARRRYAAEQAPELADAYTAAVRAGDPETAAPLGARLRELAQRRRDALQERSRFEHARGAYAGEPPWAWQVAAASVLELDELVVALADALPPPPAAGASDVRWHANALGFAVAAALRLGDLGRAGRYERAHAALDEVRARQAQPLLDYLALADPTPQQRLAVFRDYLRASPAGFAVLEQALADERLGSSALVRVDILQTMLDSAPDPERAATAAARLAEILRADPDRAVLAGLQVAALHERRGDPDRAMEVAVALAERYGATRAGSTALFAAADVRLRGGRSADAAALFERVLALEFPVDERTRWHRTGLSDPGHVASVRAAECRAALGELDVARAHLERARDELPHRDDCRACWELKLGAPGSDPFDRRTPRGRLDDALEALGEPIEAR